MERRIMSNPKVSIIVPIYNAEKDLKRGLDSLVNQTFKDIEIILVNDGSTDKSETICKEYRQKYDNVIYVCQENAGVSAARNTGLKTANAEYVMFMDADDYYAKEATEKLYFKITEGNYDFVRGGVNKNIYGTEQCVVPDFDDTDIKEQIALMTKDFSLFQVWGKLLKTSIVRDNNILFNTDLTNAEDLEWMCRYLMCCKNSSCIKDVVYYYIISNEESLSQKFNPDFYNKIDISFRSLENLYESKNMIEEYGDAIYQWNAQRLWEGFLSINSKQCKYNFKEKVHFVNTGLSTVSYQKYLQHKPREFSTVKRLIMGIKNPVLLTIAVSVFNGLIRIFRR